jgi:hypothetical protein
VPKTSQRKTKSTPENPAFSLDAERIEEEKSVARSTFPRIDSYKLTQHGLVTGQKAPSWMAFWQGCRSFLFDPIFFAFSSSGNDPEYLTFAPADGFRGLCSG